MRFLADENLHNAIWRGLLVQFPNLDIVRVQDTEVYQAPDPALLEWAAQKSRILITHDIKTIPAYAFERITKGLPMPGIIEVSDQIGIGKALEDLALLISAGEPSDFENQVIYVPLS